MTTQERVSYRWKGKLVTEKNYNRKLKLSEMSKKRRNQKQVSAPTENNDEVTRECRIINFSEMMKHMTCSSCQSDLYLSNIKKEEIFGLGSIFHISCSACTAVTKVPSSKKTDDSEGNPIFEINNKLILGCMYAGIDYKGVNEILTALEVPNLTEEKFNELKSGMRPTSENAFEEKGESALLEKRVLRSSNKIIDSGKASPRKIKTRHRPSNEIPME